MTKGYGNSTHKKQQRQKKGAKLSIFSRIVTFLYVIGFLFLIFYCFRLPIYNSILDSNSLSVEAVIIDEKNILGKGVITDMFTYSYKFNIGDNSYYGDSKDEKYQPGNKIIVEYWPTWPFINRPVKDKAMMND